jgi:hypothetical protein
LQPEPACGRELPGQNIQIFIRQGIGDTGHKQSAEPRVEDQSWGTSLRGDSLKQYTVHVFPDERAFFATATYVDTVHRLNGQWKIVHRDESLTSLTLLPAFPTAP